MRYLSALLARTKKPSAPLSQSRSVSTTAGQHKRRRRLLFLEQLEDRKLLTAGMLDPSFGVGGKVVSNFSNVPQLSAGAPVIQADGRIVIAGTTLSNNAQDFVAVRYNQDGALDATFGTGGRVAIDFDSPVDHCFGAALQADGKIVLLGNSYQPAQGTFQVLARLNTNGSLDNSFGTNGKVLLNLSSDGTPNSVAIQNDGKIVVAATTHTELLESEFAVIRLNSNGSLDNTFDGDGKQTVNFGVNAAVTSVPC